LDSAPIPEEIIERFVDFLINYVLADSVWLTIPKAMTQKPFAEQSRIEKAINLSSSLEHRRETLLVFYVLIPITFLFPARLLTVLD